MLKGSIMRRLRGASFIAALSVAVLSQAFVPAGAESGYIKRTNNEYWIGCSDANNVITDGECANADFWAADSEGYGGVVKLTEEKAFSGKTSLKVTGDGTYVKWFTLSANTHYYASYSMLCATDAFPDITFYLINEDGTPYVLEENTSSTNHQFDQLGMASVDGAWHTRTFQFLTRDDTRVGFKIEVHAGTCYLDLMRIFKADHATEMNQSPQVPKAIESTAEKGCAAENNQVPNWDMSEGDAFWKDYAGYGKFIEADKKEKVLHYKANGDHFYYMASFDVKPHTDYVFSYYVQVLESGKAVYGLQDADSSNATIGKQIELTDKTKHWTLESITFNSGDSQSVAFAVYDGGGEAVFTKLRLFEADQAVALSKDDVPAKYGSFVDTGYTLSLSCALLSILAGIVCWFCVKKRKMRVVGTS